MNFFINNPAREHKSRPSSWLVNVSVRWKLNLIIIILVVGFAGIFYSAYVGLQALQYHISNLYDFMLIPVTSLDQADIALGNVQTQLETIRSDYLSTSDKVAVLDSIASEETIFSTILQRYKTSWLTTLDVNFTQTLKEQKRLDLQQDEIKTLSTIKSEYDFYVQNRNNLRATVEAGHTGNYLPDSTIAALSNTRIQLRHLTDITRLFAEVSKKAAQDAYQQSVLAMGATLAGFAIVGLILAFVIARSITNRLGLVTQAAQSLQQGHLEERATTSVGGRDEIAQMAVAFDAMGEQLTQTLSGLEQHVKDRTAELEQANLQTAKRARELETISEVSRVIATEQDLNKVLPLVTHLVSERFNYYHAGIFLVDEAQTYAVLRAANSEGGQRMLEHGHKLEVGQTDIVGIVAQMGIPRIALDIGDDAMFFNNPDLPKTRSEIALPLKLREKTIGVLDVQSTEPAAFTQATANTLSILAGQVAIAIENARLISETQRALTETQSLYSKIVSQRWEKASGRELQLGYLQSLTGGKSIEQLVHKEEIDQALDSGEMVVVMPGKQTKQTGNQPSITIPIKLRDQVIGVLNVLSPDKNHSWNQNELTLTQAISDRIGVAIENARLLEDSQNQASKERVIGEISTKISAATNMENILKTAVGELGNIIPDTDIFIQFVSGQELE